MSTTTTYKFETPFHKFEFEPNPDSPDNVSVVSESRESIEDFLATLELAGVADDRDFSELLIEEDGYDAHYDPIYFVEITKSDLALFLQFETLNYL